MFVCDLQSCVSEIGTVFVSRLKDVLYSFDLATAFLVQFLSACQSVEQIPNHCPSSSQ
jgi:hypothetical protein